MSVINIFLLLQIRLVLVRVELFDEINRYNMRFDATILLFINIENRYPTKFSGYVLNIFGITVLMLNLREGLYVIF